MVKLAHPMTDTDYMRRQQLLLLAAWKQLVRAYLVAFLISLAIGLLLIKVGRIQPEPLFEASTRRIAYALPVFELGARWGVDLAVLLFGWNVMGALVTLSFVYSAGLFNPDRMHLPPHALRRIFCGSRKMKLLCYLPGCSQIAAESLRRLYVWLMVPLLGIILLGLESGLQVATATELGGSLLSAGMSLAPHGLIEIPTFTLAGAVPFSAHLRIRAPAQRNQTQTVFQELADHCKAMPIRRIVGAVVAGLLLSGLVEAHVTAHLMGAM